MSRVPVVAVAAILLLLLPWEAPQSASQLGPTTHASVGGALEDLWLVPSEAERHPRKTLVYKPLEEGVDALGAGDYAKALSLVTRRALAGTELASYAEYYTGLAQMKLARADDARSSRGLSMRGDGPLDMRLDPSGPVTAGELVNTLPERELARILREFGEEPAAGRIARNIVRRRGEAPIMRTGELAGLVREAIGPGASRGKIDPATRSFQALRIAVNDELASLASLLGAIERAPGRVNL